MKGEGNSVLIEEGWQKVLVTNCEVTTSKSGNEMWVITTEHPQSGSVDTVYAVTEKGKRWKFKSFLDACGYIKNENGMYCNVEPEDCIGKTVEVLNRPEINEFIKRDGEKVSETRNSFTQFRKAQGKATL